MTADDFARVTALAPQQTVDLDGLARSFAAFERGLAAETPGAARASRRCTRPSHHVRRVALAGVGAVAVTAAAIVLPVQLHASRPVATSAGGSAQLGSRTIGLLPAAAAAEPGCTGPVIDDDTPITIPRTSWASSPVRPVISLVGDGTPDGAWATKTPRTCPAAVPDAVVYDVAHRRGINVYRDVATTSMSAVEQIHDSTAMTIRGTTAHVFASRVPGDGPHQRITWFDPQGRRWYAEAENMSASETVSVLDALAFTASGHLRPASVPTGFKAAPASKPGVGKEPSYTWAVQYAGNDSTYVTKGAMTYDVPSPDYLYLEVTEPSLEPIESRAAGYRKQLVDFDGTTAAWTLHGQGGAELTWENGGATYRLVAEAKNLDAMLAIARTVHTAEPGDARLG